MNYDRRSFLKGLAALTGAAAGSSMLLDPRALAQQAADPRFLIVLCASGGASIIDGPLAIRASESANPDAINTFPDALVTGFDGSPFRAADLAGPSIGQIPASYSVQPSAFLAAHRQHLMVATQTRTSVNHAIGQRRSITGNEAWQGRTLQELVAWQYGAAAPLANVHLVGGMGFNEPGTDDTIPPWARGQIVSNPGTWPLSLDGSRGTTYPMNPALLDAIRQHRDQVFEPGTSFDRVFGHADRVSRWKALRGTPQEQIEALDLISKLMVFNDSPAVPLADYGLDSSPLGDLVRATFPDFAFDPLQAQAALAFLLIKYGVSVSVTMGPNFDFVLGPGEGNNGSTLPLNSVRNPPLAFDVCHQGHRAGQAVGWDRLYKTMHGLIQLLSAEDFGDGTSLWDRTLIYVASDFGREKHRPAGASDWGTGHHLNNGVLIASPLVPGDTLRGGVDPDTALTYGFDLVTGAPEPGREMEEAEIFAGLLGALGVDTSGSGLPDVPAMR